MRISGAFLVLLGSTLPAWADGAVGRLSWASHQVNLVGNSTSANPLRGILLAALLGAALGSVCLWVRRSHPPQPDEIPHR